MTYVFWHSYLMFHQAAYIRALAEVPGTTVRWCVTEDLPAYYRDRGYPVPDTGKVLVHIAPTPERTAELARLPGSVQVFFGLRGFALPLAAFKSSLGAPVHHQPVQRDHKEILYVGQLITRKRVDLLLQAFSQLDLPTARLRIIGKGDQEQPLQQLAHQLGIAERVSFTPGMPNAGIVAAMAAADVLVLPSRFDGWGAVVNEALMVGTPVICSDRCGASDVIENGRNGYVFEAGNARALLECLHSICHNFHWDRDALASTESTRLGGPAVAARFQLHAMRLLSPGPAAVRPTAPMDGVPRHRGQQP